MYQTWYKTILVLYSTSTTTHVYTVYRRRNILSVACGILGKRRTDMDGHPAQSAVAAAGSIRDRFAIYGRLNGAATS